MKVAQFLDEQAKNAINQPVIKSIGDIGKIDLVGTVKGENGEEKTLLMSPVYRTPSMKAQNDILEVRKQQIEKLTDVDKKYKDIFDSDTNDTDAAIALSNKHAEVLVINAEFTIEYFKAIIVTKNLTTQEQELLNDGEFWADQDITKIQNAVASFRSLIGA